ncbi:methyltransferase domain-containing protein [Streptomyces sp. NPDC052727]|uniref:methyltransferase domain-containing protein n=1 Tax=unclassified Streptomyces TaxID=2593676 RepID=UPI003444FAD2
MTTREAVDVQGYFAEKARSYDERGRGFFGELSDELLWTTLQQSVLTRLPPGFSFLEPGGGTGRWSCRLAVERPDATGVLYDMTPEMLTLAEGRSARHGYADRVAHGLGKVETAAEHFGHRRFDLILNTHHVLGFVDDPAAVVRSLATLLTENGVMASFLPSRWYAASLDLAAGRVEDAEISLTGERWVRAAEPYRHLFTPGEIRAIHYAAGLTVDLLVGFPSLVLPDTRPGAANGGPLTEEYLSDGAVFRRVLNMEKELLVDPDSAARGVNLFVVASRSPWRAVQRRGQAATARQVPFQEPPSGWLSS